MSRPLALARLALRRGLALVAVTSFWLPACQDETETAALGCPAPTQEKSCSAGPDGRIDLPRDEALVEPGCTHWQGSVHVPDAYDPDTLTPLCGIRSIEGSLTLFRNHGIRSLHELGHLERIGGELGYFIEDEGELTSFEGLEQLREIGGLVVYSTHSLTSLRGLDALEVVHGDVTLHDNVSLPRREIDALLARIRVEGTVTLEP